MCEKKSNVSLFWVFIIVVLAMMIIPVTLMFGYVDDQNKFTSDPIQTTIIVKDFKYEIDWYGFGYFSVIDTNDRGYFTTIGPSSGRIPKLMKSGEYRITYYCDKDDIRRIVKMEDNTMQKSNDSVNIYKCGVEECNNLQREDTVTVTSPNGGGGGRIAIVPKHTSEKLPDDCQAYIAGFIMYHPPNLITGWAECGSSKEIRYYNIVDESGYGSLWVNASSGHKSGDRESFWVFDD